MVLGAVSQRMHKTKKGHGMTVTIIYSNATSSLGSEEAPEFHYIKMKRLLKRNLKQASKREIFARGRYIVLKTSC